MQKSVKILLAVLGVVVAGVLIGWLSGTGSGPKTPLPAGSSQPDTSIPPVPVAQASRVKPATDGLPAHVAPRVTHPAPASSDIITNWEERLDAILVSNKEDSEKANQLLEMFPHLAEDAQSEVAQHLSNLVSDENYASLAQYLTNSTLPESVLDVLFGDALNRPNSLKLPVLVDVARDPQNPKAGEAKDILQLFLEQDYGTDWNTWQAKVDQWLKDNPD